MKGEGNDRRTPAPADPTVAAAAHHCPTCGRSFPGDARFCPFDGHPLDAASGDPAHVDPFMGQLVDGRYEVEELLGQGGMGTVYAARHRALGKRFALKVMRADLAGQGDLMARFIQEARAAALIEHPNVVQIIDFGKTPAGLPYFVMELLEGTPLSKVSCKGGPLPSVLAVRILQQVAAGLSAAHAAGVIHRDLKPDNIHVTGESSVKILDFGVARVAGTGRLTLTGMVFGSPHYMSPEQASGGAIDHRADIYALGVIMYEMFTGRVPFEADSYMGVLTKHMFMQPEPLGRVYEPAGELGALERVIFKCLEKDPTARYASMEELIRDFENVVGLGGETLEMVRASRVASQPRVRLADPTELPAQDELQAPLIVAGVPQKVPIGSVALAVLLLTAAAAGAVFAWNRATHAPSRSSQPGGREDGLSARAVPAAFPSTVSSRAALPSCADSSAINIGPCDGTPSSETASERTAPPSTARGDPRAAASRRSDVHSTNRTPREPKLGPAARPAPGPPDIVNPWAK